MYSKKAVSDSFSRFSSFYEEYAEAQAEAAIRLSSFIKKNLGTKKNANMLPDGPVLEIGCGTGFVTREIIPLFPEKKFLVTDISCEMCKTCRNHLINCGTDTSGSIFAVYDGESAWPENRFSMIFSGFTIQWFTSLEDSLPMLAKALKQGGILAFSFQSEGSFQEWEKACKKLDIPFTANPLPSIDSVSSILSGYGMDVVHTECSIPVTYRSSSDFFRALKRIGAGTMTKEEHLSPAMMKRLMKKLDNSDNSGLTVTYRAGLFFIRNET